MLLLAMVTGAAWSKSTRLPKYNRFPVILVTSAPVLIVIESPELDESILTRLLPSAVKWSKLFPVNEYVCVFVRVTLFNEFEPIVYTLESVSSVSPKAMLPLTVSTSVLCIIKSLFM